MRMAGSKPRQERFLNYRRIQPNSFQSQSFLNVFSFNKLYYQSYYWQLKMAGGILTAYLRTNNTQSMPALES